jgi:tRNA modification GTPase
MSATADTIVAVATPPGRGGVGVIRVSGAFAAIQELTAKLVGRVPEPRKAVLVLTREADGTPLDQGLAIYFPGPGSYTGEDVLEFHGHGNPVLLQAIVTRCIQLGARLAGPGEFTQRAYLNGKLDLAQAEAVADLIGASTTRAARSAMRSLEGEFSQAVHDALAQLIQIRKLIEAHLDFSEEEIPFDHAGVGSRIKQASDAIGAVLMTAKQGSILRDGITVALVGPPNVGKSSLLNALAGQDLAIVTPIPGTTRDVIRAEIDIDGVKLNVLDTAGLRESKDLVEQEGIARTRDVAGKADLLLVMQNDGQPAPDTKAMSVGTADIPVIRIRNKIDLSGGTAGIAGSHGSWTVSISVRTGAGIDDLRHLLLSAAGAPGAGEGVFLARARHVTALRTARDSVDRSHQTLGSLELCAEELRSAQTALNSITGEFLADDLLGEIFRDFCIGK